MKNYELGYDAENRLTSVTGVDGQISPLNSLTIPMGSA